MSLHNEYTYNMPLDKNVQLKLFFLFLNLNIRCVYSKEPPQWDGSFEHQKQMFKLMHKKIYTILAQKIVYLSLCNIRINFSFFSAEMHLLYLFPNVCECLLLCCHFQYNLKNICFVEKSVTTLSHVAILVLCILCDIRVCFIVYCSNILEISVA